MITGANGHLGLRLMAALDKAGRHEVVALVRSEAAAETIRRAGLAADIRVIDYGDVQALRSAAEGCRAVVHLVGIIKQTRRNPFSRAHEEPCRALVEALEAGGEKAGRDREGVERIICVGVLGTHANSTNPCFQSRHAAEQTLLTASTPALILRVPMVLGGDDDGAVDYAVQALAARAMRPRCLAFRAGSLEQPIDSRDLVKALLAALELPPESLGEESLGETPRGSSQGNSELELAGPESLSRAALIHRAAACLGQPPPKVISLPLFLGLGLAWLLERLAANPPITRAMLGVLDHDDQIDAGAAAAKLGLTLTPLDDTLSWVLSTSLSTSPSNSSSNIRDGDKPSRP